MKKLPALGWINLDQPVVREERADLRRHASRFREAIAREEALGTARTKNPAWNLAKRKMLGWADALDREAGTAVIDVVTPLLN